jgi:hypothetical protein
MDGFGGGGWRPTAVIASIQAAVGAADARGGAAPHRLPYDADVAAARLAECVAARDVAAADLTRAETASAAADAALADAEAALAEFADTADRTAAHYAKQITAGEPLVLTTDLQAEVEAQRAATTHRDTVLGAQRQLARDVQRAKEAADAAEDAAAAAAIECLRCTAEHLADRAVAARAELIGLRRELMNLGAAMVRGQRPKFSSVVMDVVRDPLPGAGVDAIGIRAWTQRARDLAAGLGA